MNKRVALVVAVLAVWALGPAAFGRPRAGVSVDTERARAAAEARVRKAVAKADRAARAAGVRVTVRNRGGNGSDSRSLGARRRDAMRRSIEKKLLGAAGPASGR